LGAESVLIEDIDGEVSFTVAAGSIDTHLNRMVFPCAGHSAGNVGVPRAKPFGLEYK